MASGFLRKLAGSSPVHAGAIAIVVAHPDDETIGAGGQLSRLRDVTVVHVTDGAPRNLADAEAHGFARREAYAAARRRELADALRCAGFGPERLTGLGIADQETAFHLVEIASRLQHLLAGAEIVLTHAYEGGHPDHDAVAFSVHAAARLRARDIGNAPSIIEMPLYRAGLSGWLRQTFALRRDCPETTIELTPEQRRTKARMIAAHHSQREVLAGFPLAVERFRPAPDYDFQQLPNGGRLLYESYDWGMTGKRWQELAGEALEALELAGR